MLKQYDEGKFDKAMRKVGIRRDKGRMIYTTTDEELIQELAQNYSDMDVEEVQKLQSGQIYEEAVKVATSLRIPIPQKSKRTMTRLKGRLLEQLRLKARDTLQVTIRAENLDITSGEWKGAPEDVRYCSRNKCLKNIDLSHDEVADQIASNKRSQRKINPGCMYKNSDRNDDSALQLDISQYPDGTSVCIEIENETHNVQIALMPKKCADELSELLKILYRSKKDGGIGFSKSDLNNSQRKSPIGWMTSFGIRQFVNGVVQYYRNTAKNETHNGMSSYSIIGRITAIIYDFLKHTYPGVVEEIQKDNKPTHGDHRPPYIQEGKIISPRIIISNLLGNEAHVDAGDKGISVVAWVAEDPDESTEDWRFVLQALRTCEHGKQRDTISVQLQHGIIMIYDGRAVRHATSVPNLDGSMKWGIFHGSI